jgi:hypothetical protein
MNFEQISEICGKQKNIPLIYADYLLFMVLPELVCRSQSFQEVSAELRHHLQLHSTFYQE